MTPTADAHVRAQVSPQYRCFVFVKSRNGGYDDDNKHGADGIAETHHNGNDGKDDDDIACQFVIVRVAGVARI